MIKLKIAAILLAGAMAFTLAACGSSDTTESTASESESASETATPSESETAEPSESEDEDRLAPDGVWETDGERVTIEGDTVTIDHIDDEGEVTETYWVGSFELDEDSDTWTSTRDPNAEMTCESETIEFTWSGEGDNMYDKLSYAVTNEDGTTKTVTLDRTESLGDVEKGVVPNLEDSGSGDTAAGTSASPSASNSKNSDTASANDTTSAAASASTGSNSNNDSSDKSGSTSSGTTSNNNSGSTSNNSGNGGSSNSGSGNSGSSNSGSNSSSNNSGGSSGTTSTACSHNYVGNVTKAATCSAAGVKTYTCSKCGASYTESIPATGHSYNGGVVTKAATCSTAGTTTYTCTKCGNSYTSSIPATGNHNWQAVYKTVHHDATGHYETQNIGGYKCNYSGCGAVFTTGDDVCNHIILAHDGHASYSSTIISTNQVWVQDSSAYDEQVVDYYKCTACGATK